MLAYLAKEFDVVRVKNRFENDEVEEVNAERLQAEFYAAETLGEDSDSSSSGASSGSSKAPSAPISTMPTGCSGRSLMATCAELSSMASPWSGRLATS